MGHDLQKPVAEPTRRAGSFCFGPSAELVASTPSIMAVSHGTFGTRRTAAGSMSVLLTAQDWVQSMLIMF
jgi:hypothetical protein